MSSIPITAFWVSALALSMYVATAQSAEPSSQPTSAQGNSSQQRKDGQEDRMGRGKESDWAGQHKPPAQTENSRNKTEQR